MATLIQIRRDTQQNWITNDPVLAAGEFAFSIDENKIKVGNGVSNWTSLLYINATPSEITSQINAAIASVIDTAPAALDTLNELAAAINDDPTFFTTIATNLSNHESDTTNIHGIANTADLATKSYADSAVSTHSNDTTDIHGISNTSDLVYINDSRLSDARTPVAHTHTTSDITSFTEDVQDVIGDMVSSNTESGISVSYDDESGKLNFNVNDPTITLSGDVTGSATMTDLGNVNITTTIAADSVALGNDTTGDYVATISGTQDQIIVSGSGSETAAVTLSLPQDVATTSSPTFAGGTLDAVRIGITNANKIDTSSGNLILDSDGGTVQIDDNLTVSGNLTINGTTTTINANTITVDDKNIELGSVDTPTDLTADGGGIILKGDTDKNISWSASTSSWSLSENLNIESNKVIKFGGTSVLSATDYIGNAATVTNGVYTTGVYVNPSWINQLEWSKITSTPTTLLGYGISDIDAAKTYLELQHVENTALSTWSGSTSITFLGTITTGTWNGSVISDNYVDESVARLNSPTFTGSVILPSVTSIGDVSSAEISYLDGVTSSIQSQLDGKLESSVASTTYAPLESPTFTGNVLLPLGTSIGDVSSTEISYLDGVTSSIQNQLNSKAPTESPTFTGTVSGISKSMVGLGSVDNTSDLDKPISTAQQSALDLKSNLSGATFTGFITLHADPTQAMHAVTKQYVDETSEGLQTKPAVEIATTGNLSATYNNGTNGVGATLTATSNEAFPEIDGITLSSTTPGQNGVLVKNQTNPAHNGRYNLTQIGNGSTPWILTRCGLCDEVDEIPGAYIFVKRGTLNAGSGWTLIVSDPTTFVVGTDSISAFQFSGAGTITAGTNVSVTGSQVSVITNPTFSGLITASSGVAYSDGTQTKVGVPSISSFVPKTANYTLDDLTLRDNIIEMDSTSATTVTIPPDSSLNLPVGSSLDIIQINTGEVTIAAGAGVTVNSTPGLKLRTRWSSCTLLKRAANTWIVYGDLKA